MVERQIKIKNEVVNRLNWIDKNLADLQKIFISKDGSTEVLIDPFLKIKYGQIMTFAPGVRGERLEIDNGYLFRGMYDKGTTLARHYHSFPEIIEMKKGRLLNRATGEIYKEDCVYRIEPYTIHEVEALEDSISIIKFEV